MTRAALRSNMTAAVRRLARQAYGDSVQGTLERAITR